MSYQVLARKWRPRSFEDMVGQAHVVRALSNALEQGQLHHAYLFTGTRGVGKTTLARILAKAALERDTSVRDETMDRFRAKVGLLTEGLDTWPTSLNARTHKTFVA